MKPALAALSLLVILFGGWGAGYLLDPRRKSLADLAAHSWLLGSLLLSLALALCGTLLSGASLIGAVTAVTLIPGIVAIRELLTRTAPQFAWPRPRTPLEWTLCAIIAVQCLILLRFASTAAIGWDGLMVWEIKARIAFANGGRLPLDYFSDISRSWSHPDYPLMFPLLETWVYLWIGESNQTWLRLLFPLFYFAALLLLYSGVAQLTGKRWAGLLTAVLLFFIPFVTVGNCNVFTGYADFPLAVYYLAAIVYFLKYTDTRAGSPPILFALYAGALPWVKQEGAFLWFFILLVASAHFLRRRDPRRLLLVAAPGLISIVGWRTSLHIVKAIPSSDFMKATPGNLFNNISRIGSILHALVSELCAIENWSFLWIILPIALLWVAFRQSRRVSFQLLALIIFPLAFYSCIYILSAWVPYHDHIVNSLPRLISDLSLVALLTLGLSASAISE